MRTLKVLLVFALLSSIGAFGQKGANGCGVYPRDSWALDSYAVTYTLVWFVAEGDPTAIDIANSPGWKSWIAVTNLATKEGVSIRLDFNGLDGKTPVGVWKTVRGGDPSGTSLAQFGLHPGETIEIRLLAKSADRFTPTSGLAVGSVRVTFTSQDTCDLDLQGKVALTFVCIKADGRISRIGTVDAVRVDAVTNKALAGITGTPSWARNGNSAIEIPSFAVMNLASFQQDIKVSLIGPDSNPIVPPKYVTLEPGAVTGTEVESLFGVESFNTSLKTLVCRLVFEGTGPLFGLALEFVGPEAMGPRRVWSF